MEEVKISEHSGEVEQPIVEDEAEQRCLEALKRAEYELECAYVATQNADVAQRIGSLRQTLGGMVILASVSATETAPEDE